ncbi:PEP-CTERM sorting domain-containing protein [bacterium]|nr:PEP-CTERM sorting domain-containing protein [bacterium]
MKHTLYIAILGVLPCGGASLTINTQNTFAGLANPFTDKAGTALGSSSLVQFGFFADGTAPSNEGDSFDGFTSVDSVLIELGVGGNPDGSFSQTIILDNATDLPGGTPATLQFGLRIFDGSNEGNSEFFNTVTNEAWEFTFTDQNPPPPPSEILLDPILGAAVVASSIWEGGSSSAFGTSIAVPEPSTFLSALLGLGLLASRRRRA